MSKDCLVKKYKKTVSNPDLLPIGAFKVSFKVGNNKFINIASSASPKVVVELLDATIDTVTNGTKIDNTHAEVNIFPSATTGFTINESVSNVNAILHNKYDIERVSNAVFDDTVNIKYSSGLTTLEGCEFGNGSFADLPNSIKDLSIEFSGGDFDLSDIGSHTTLEKFNLNTKSRSVLTGNISNLATLVNLKYVQLNVMQNIIGDISVFGNMPSLINLNISGSAKLSGTVESIVAKFRGKSKTTGSITTPYLGQNQPNITFNGNVITGTTSSTKIEWTATTITFNGTTINNSDVTP